MKLVKVLKYFLILIFSLTLLLYFALNVFVKSKEVKVDEGDLLRASTVSLSDEQIKIASIVLNKNDNPKFHGYFFLINDAFSKRNYVAHLTADVYLGEKEDVRRMRSLERQIRSLATKRYIMKNIDYATCYNYLFSKLYFGNAQYGLSNASEFYYSKSYGELADKEFISLCLLLKNPNLYDFSLDKNSEIESLVHGE